MDLVGYFISLLGLCSLLFVDDLAIWVVSCCLVLLGVVLVITEGLFKRNWQERALFLFFSGYFAFSAPFAGIVAGLYPERSVFQFGPADLETWVRVLAVYTLGWLFLAMGFHTAWSPWIPSGKGTANPSGQTYSWPTLLAVSMAGLACRVYVDVTFKSAEFASVYESVGGVFGTTADLGLITALALSASSKGFWRITGIALLGGYTLSGAVTGQRAGVFSIALFGAIFFFLLRERLTLKNFAIPVVVFMAVMAITFPILTSYKRQMAGSLVAATELERVSEAFSAWKSAIQETAEADEYGFVELVRRFSQLQFGGVLMTTVLDDIGYQYGHSILQGLLLVIPRILWVDKPTDSWLTLVAYKAIGYESGGAIEIPLAPDWFLNFWWPGVCVGMFLTGCLYGLVNRLLAGKDILLTALLAVLVWLLSSTPHGISGIISSLIIYGTAVFVLRMVAGRCPT